MAEPIVIQCIAAEKLERDELCYVKNEKLYRFKKRNRIMSFFNKKFARQQFRGSALYDAEKGAWGYMHIT